MLKSGQYLICDPCYIVPNVDYVYFRPLFSVPPSLSEADFQKLNKEYIKADIWSAWLKEYEDFDSADYYFLESKKSFVGNTRLGDGCYPLFYKDKEIKELDVDSGLLGILPVELFNKLNPNRDVENFIYKRNVELITMEKDFKVDYKNGDFYFGDYYVETSVDEDDY